MCISDFSKCELLALANTIAISLSKDFSSEDLITLASFFTILGDMLALLSIEN